MKKSRGWTGLPRGRALWDTPELRAAHIEARKKPLPVRLAKFRTGTDEPDKCWGWAGAKTVQGYPKLTIDKKLRLATHVALEVDGRPRPSDGHFACHACDNPECTNPAHLWWGTPSENTRDAWEKGRMKAPAGRRKVAR